MATPEANAQNIVDLVMAASGGAIASPILLDLVRTVLGRRKAKAEVVKTEAEAERAEAEAEKLQAEAAAVLQKALHQSIGQVMEAYRETIGRHESTIARHEATMRNMSTYHRRELDRIWRYVETLRNELRKAGLPPPAIPPLEEAQPAPDKPT